MSNTTLPLGKELNSVNGKRMNCNMNIFEFIKLETDPIYNLISSLHINKEIEIDGFTIRKDKFYEVENEDIHIGFKDLRSCYQFVSHSVVANTTKN